MIKAIRKSKTTAICPDCGKQHRIHKVSQGEYLKGCIYPCCVYWVEDTNTSPKDKPPLLTTAEGKVLFCSKCKGTITPDETWLPDDTHDGRVYCYDCAPNDAIRNKDRM